MSTCSKSAADLVEEATLPPESTRGAIASSICLVTSGRAGAPSWVENLMPLYSGGLWEAVKLIAPEVLRVWTAYAIAGVGAA